MGGGGGGGRGLTPDELGRLERAARESLRAGAGTGKRNVFISFASEDLNEVNMLRGQAKSEVAEIEFNDWSVKKPFDSKDAEYIRRGIRERIRQCSVTVAYLSDKTADSRWVDWEIKESMALGKGVVGMYKGEKPPSRLPKVVTDKKILVVPWNQEELARAIKKQSGRR
jgi:hypothetical protein